ncbi:hypothetical protein CUR178_01970 [Leishmania enriettii]|uniref:Uncharacterized protein n=1 Tax=Leishmania enriettii TaxID=5663 RepID=A0A836GQ98_LEIEN|nr:hypothetical protein CUR178_01970 [Leishmania enriettii]
MPVALTNRLLRPAMALGPSLTLIPPLQRRKRVDSLVCGAGEVSQYRRWRRVRRHVGCFALRHPPAKHALDDSAFPGHLSVGLLRGKPVGDGRRGEHQLKQLRQCISFRKGTGLVASLGKKTAQPLSSSSP